MCPFRISVVCYNVGQPLMSVQLQFQLSVLTVRSFAGFSLYLTDVDRRKNLSPQFLMYHNDHRTNQLEISCSARKNYNTSTQTTAGCVWGWHNVDRSGFRVAQEVKKGGCGRWPRCRRLATSRAEEIIELVRRKVYGDYCLTVRMIAKAFDMNCKRVWTIITNDLVKEGR